MAEEADDDSKTIEPTEKRLADARDKGQLPMAREAALAGLLAGILIVLVAMLIPLGARLAGHLQRMLAASGDVQISTRGDALALLGAVAGPVAFIMTPALALFVIAGMAAGSVPERPRVVLSRISPKASHISPMAGFRRIFGQRGLVEFAKSVLKIALAFAALAIAVGRDGTMIGNLSALSPQDGMVAMQSVALRMVAALLAFATALVIFDIGWSRLQWLKDLRMTHQEMRDEQKESDGNPALKARRQGLHRARVRAAMMADVPKATVIITNPTHFAVALRYRPEETGVPQVVAKGMDFMAERIKEKAREAGVPMIEDVTLARALHRSVEVGQHIPVEFYQAVAEIIHYLGHARHREGPMPGRRQA